MSPGIDRVARLRLALTVLALATCNGCGSAQGESRSPTPTGANLAPSAAVPGGLAFAAPDEHGLDARPLIELTDRIRTSDAPIFSLLISRDGALVYELYTSSLTREHAHYVMSITKSFTSALMGAAMDRHLVGPPETSVADALPPKLFASDADRTRFRDVTIKDVLGMSALDAQVPPHRALPEDRDRERQFLASPNRTAFALTQAVLPTPGTSYQYTDITPLIATGIVEYATKMTALEFAEQTLFGPMDFRNYEWMHEDETGIDNGAYGLRLRPIDMQKFGVLYLQGGRWQGRQLLPRDWTLRSFSPWIKSFAGSSGPNYGWYWWTSSYAPHWLAHVARGWKGQRIAVFPEKDMVVTMTGIVEDQDEETLFARIIRDYVIPSVDGRAGEPARPDPALRRPLAELLEEVRRGPLRGGPGIERRMIPTVEHKARHHAFSPR